MCVFVFNHEVRCCKNFSVLSGKVSLSTSEMCRFRSLCALHSLIRAFALSIEDFCICCLADKVKVLKVVLGNKEQTRE